MGLRVTLLTLGLIGAAMPAIAQDSGAMPTPTPLEPGRPQSDTLTSGGPRLVEHDMYYDLYSFSGRAGERVQIDLRSDAFDPYLELGRLGADGRFTMIAENDDADGLNSRIVQELPESGDYLVRARTVGAGGTGAFTIELRRLGDAPPAPAPVSLRPGRETEGRFGDDEPQIVDEMGGTSGRPYRLYSVDARAGQTYTISLRSQDFDAVLDVGGLTPAGFAAARTNDDAEGDAGGDDGTDSQIVIRAERNGPLAIRASALRGGASGAYRIEVR